MSKYIEVDALIKALRLEYPMMPMFKENRKEWEVKTEGYRKAEKIISNAPSIDIVHCRECKHERFCSWRNSGFCGFGEREGE